MLKLLGWSVRPCSSPGPVATTLLGSHPSDTETLNGLLGTGVSSYRTWTLWTPKINKDWHKWNWLHNKKGFMLSSSVLTGCVTIFKRSVLDTVGAISLVCNHTVCQSSRRVLDRRLYVVSTSPGQRTSIHRELCGGFSENSWREGKRKAYFKQNSDWGTWVFDHYQTYSGCQVTSTCLLWRSFIKLEITPITKGFKNYTT